MHEQLPAPKAFKQSPSLELSTWHKGILGTQLAGEQDTGGAFDLVVVLIEHQNEFASEDRQL
jgi:hypothetical protein